MFPNPILERAQQVLALYKERGLRLVTAESCTGGLVAAALIELPGASSVLERGFVSYSNDSKIDLLGVMPDSLALFGSVSAEVAEAMADGALAYSHADVGIAITGIAGPSGGTPEKPVGLVYFGLARRKTPPLHYRCEFSGDRQAIRLQAVAEALRLLLSVLEDDIQPRKRPLPL